MQFLADNQETEKTIKDFFHEVTRLRKIFGSRCIWRSGVQRVIVRIAEDFQGLDLVDYGAIPLLLLALRARTFMMSYHTLSPRPPQILKNGN